MISRLFDISVANKKLWIGLGTLVFLSLVLSSVPAQFGAAMLTRGTGLAMSGVTGSLWNGHASLASVKLEGKDYSLGTMTWSLKPLSFLTFKPCAYLTTRMEGQQFDGTVCSGGSSLLLKDAMVQMPAVMVQQHLPFPVGGELSMHFDELSVRGNVLLKLKGNLSWMGARANNGARWVDLGNYAAEFQDNDNNGIKGKFFELAGPIDVDLSVELYAPSGGRIVGSLAAPEGFIQSSGASEVLALFSQQNGDDGKGNARYSVDFNL
jgi:general secretion pathway protein N